MSRQGKTVDDPNSPSRLPRPASPAEDQGRFRAVGQRRDIILPPLASSRIASPTRPYLPASSLPFQSSTSSISSLPSQPPLPSPHSQHPVESYGSSYPRHSLPLPLRTDPSTSGNPRFGWTHAPSDHVQSSPASGHGDIYSVTTSNTPYDHRYPSQSSIYHDNSPSQSHRPPPSLISDPSRRLPPISIPPAAVPVREERWSSSGASNAPPPLVSSFDTRQLPTLYNSNPPLGSTPYNLTRSVPEGGEWQWTPMPGSQRVDYSHQSHNSQHLAPSPGAPSPLVSSYPRQPSGYAQGREDRSTSTSYQRPPPISSSLPPAPSTSRDPPPPDPAVKKKRKRADQNQLAILNETFKRTAFPSTEERADLAKRLGMSARSVQIWFQNKRQATRQNRVTAGAYGPLPPSTEAYTSSAASAPAVTSAPASQPALVDPPGSAGSSNYGSIGSSPDFPPEAIPSSSVPSSVPTTSHAPRPAPYPTDSSRRASEGHTVSGSSHSRRRTSHGDQPPESYRRRSDRGEQ